MPEAGFINLDFSKDGVLLKIELWGSASKQLPEVLIPKKKPGFWKKFI